MRTSNVTKVTILLTLILCLSVFYQAPLAGTGPNPTAFSTFETLHSAEASGANIKSLLDQYNILLQQQSSNASYTTLAGLAAQAQQSAINDKNSGNLLAVALVPIIALLLAVTSIVLVSAARRIRQNKLLDMRIRGN